LASRTAAIQPPIGQAPGALATVQAFVNTLDIEQGTDKLDRPAALDRWLAETGLHQAGTRGAAATGPADLRRAIELREALRGVLRSHVTGEQPAGPARSLGRIAADLAARFDVGADGQIRLAPAAGTGPSAALAGILLIAADATADGTWRRLKACSADDCHWAFYDRSPTRNGSWCSMQVCGSRAKSRAYRERSAASRAAVLGVAHG
jgi:predicted RNA-binding Zn ribbon-like protein